MIEWLMQVADSFDGSDIFAFIAGSLAVIFWKNVSAMKINNDGTKRKVNLPALNRKMLVWFVIAVAFLGVFWATMDTGRAIRDQSQRTQNLAVAVCENAKVSGVERKALQDLLVESMASPEQKLPVDDPRRKAAGQKLVVKYLGSLEDAEHQRQEIQAGRGIDPDFWERYFGPEYPEPDCYAPLR